METNYKEYAYAELSKQIYQFIINFIEVNEDYTDLTGNFTRHFKTDTNELDQYLNKLLDELLEEGFNFENFYREYREKILKDFNFTMHGFFMDYVLYHFDKDYPLGGNTLDDGEPDEKLIKYYYGYYKYDLGEKFILQSYPDMEDFYYDVAKNFIYDLSTGDSIRSSFRSITTIPPKEAKKIQSICSETKKYDTYSVVFLNTNFFYKMIEFFIDDNKTILDVKKAFEKDINSFDIEYLEPTENMILIFGKTKDFLVGDKYEILQNVGDEKKAMKFIKNKIMKRDAGKYNL